MKQMTPKHQMIVLWIVVFAFGLAGFARMLGQEGSAAQDQPREQVGVITGTENTGTEITGTENTDANEELTQDSDSSEDASDTGMPGDGASGQDVEMPSPGSTDGFGGSSDTPTIGDGSDTGFSTDTERRNAEIRDGMNHDFGNYIRGEETVRDPNTGELHQVESGSDTYYNSPSVDAQTGETGIYGADAGQTLPSDATQYAPVTGTEGIGVSGGDSSAGSSSGSSETP